LSNNSVVVLAAGAGNGKAHGDVPLYATDHSKTRLRRASGTAATLVVGQVIYSYSSGFVTTDSQLSGVVTLAAGDILEMQAIVTTPSSNSTNNDPPAP
jgi:hypothetical protein